MSLSEESLCYIPHVLDNFPKRVNPCKSNWFFDAKGSETLNNLLSKCGSRNLELPGAKLKSFFSRIKIRKKKQPTKPKLILISVFISGKFCKVVTAQDTLVKTCLHDKINV